MIFDQLEFARAKVIKLLEEIDEEKLRKTPTGFNNHILWNAGHIYAVQEGLTFGVTKQQTKQLEELKLLFGGGTKPADWTKSPPSLEELVSLLKEQPERIRHTFTNRLDEKIEKPLSFPGLTLATVEDLLSFSLLHEGMHIETMKLYSKIV
ncbi:DinB family protein [Halalkalibacter urbisdiaboli]|uniref:DinB family protein n=1 Tax=Halalkalibacter urbisdiaboli TaxID=1960589 RepID=UPI000B4444C1|nr:DinB family protein [Halalkalibacter urbisdiaboli]